MSRGDLRTTYTDLSSSCYDLVTSNQSCVRVSYDQGAGNATFCRSVNMAAARSIFVLLEEEEETLIFCTIGATLLSRRRRRKRNLQQESKVKKRRYWTRPWLMRRPYYGHYEKLMVELATEDQEGFRNFVRIDSELFHELLTRVGPRIEKHDTFMRKALSAGLAWPAWVCFFS